MENNEKILCKANIKALLSLGFKVFCVLWTIVVLAALYFTSFNMSTNRINITQKHSFGYYEVPGTVTSIEKRYYIWNMCFYNFDSYIVQYDTSHEDYYEYYKRQEAKNPDYLDENGRYVADDNSEDFNIVILISGIVITILALSVPFFIHLIKKGIAKSCTLTLTEKQICGQLKTFFGKKQIQIPIEKLDNIMTTNGFMDKLRSGETICVSSNSGMVKFHYVQNAENFVQEALKRIEEVKGTQAQAVQNSPAPVQNVTGGDAMEKINSLKQMLDSGLISQDEFEEKKKDILSKM